MDLLRGFGDRFVVVDVETTGVLNSDRIVEVAAVTLSPNGQVVDEWDTLVNPGRDVGPTLGTSSRNPKTRKSPATQGISVVVRDGVDPSTSGFSDPSRMFHYVSVQVTGCHFIGSMTSSAT
jgi:hypothetical protein